MKQSIIEVLTLKNYSPYFKARPKEWHKKLSGHVLIIGGALGYLGAPLMAGMAALRVGAGLVSIATRPEHAAIISSTCPEIMSHGVLNEKELVPLLEKATMVVLGPGLQTEEWGKSIWTAVCLKNLPLLLDADALNLLAHFPAKKDNWILTPHPGEAARLLHTTSQGIQDNRLVAANTLQETYGGVSVLKGAGTLVATPSTIKRCEQGNPGMSTAGMGDVLSGVIAGLAAQGAPLEAAAEMGVLIHALAGDLAVAQQGERGLLATDLMPYLRAVINQEIKN